MFFNSLEYFVFLAIVLALYYSFSHRWQNYMLLAVSYFFYGYWDYRFLSLMLISTVVDFFAGRIVDHATTESKAAHLSRHQHDRQPDLPRLF